MKRCKTTPTKSDLVVELGQLGRAGMVEDELDRYIDQECIIKDSRLRDLYEL